MQRSGEKIMKTTTAFLLVLISISTIMSTTVLAKQRVKQKSKKSVDEYVVYEQKTVIDFDGIDIDGRKKNPSAMLIFGKTRKTFSLLIDMQRKFGYRILRASQDIQDLH